MNYSIKDLSKITHSKIFGDENLIVESIYFDSRSIFSAKNQAFIAINTQSNSGEKYIEDAINKGIRIIISEKKLETNQEVTWLIVDNSIKFLQEIAKHHLLKFDLGTIGITGSNGKTVIKEWLFQCLNEDYHIVKSPKSYNSQLGLPLSILEINQQHNLGIFEVGISKPHEMENQKNIISPKIGILTHIGTAHLSNFSSLKELIQEKISLFEDSEIIFYNNLPLVKQILEEKYPSKPKISFGFSPESDVYLNADWEDKSKDIEIFIKGESFTVPVNERNEATLNNLLGLIALLDYYQFSHEKMIQKINELKSVEMRLERVEGINNNIIIDDSFNLDIDSLIIAFQSIKEYTKKNKVLILTDFSEHKDSKEEFYKHIADITNQQDFKNIILIGTEITQFSSLFTSPSICFNNTNEVIDSQYLKEIKNSLILLKGARIFQIEKIKKKLAFKKHDTVLEVNLNGILHNLNVHKNLLKPTTKVMAMVKAFAYGLGGYEIAEFLQYHHIDYLGVAYADEGISLRKKGISVPIIVMNPEQSSYESIINYNLEPEIYSFRVLELFSEQLKAKGINRKYPIHIKLETGMHRLGFKEDELEKLNESLKNKNVEVKSIFSHLSCADDPSEDEYTLFQLDNFKRMSSTLCNRLGYQPIRHILNSSGIVNFNDYQYDMVRIGIGLMGISPNESIQKELVSVAKFKTVISQISAIKKGESIGYNRKYKAIKDTKIATIPVGYADGIPRLLGNKNGNVYIKNKVFPIVGNVCMDMMMVDIQDLVINEGNEVIIFDSIEELKTFAKKSQTIVYESLTSISLRVKRIYIK